MSNYCLQTTVILKMMPKAVLLSARSLKAGVHKSLLHEFGVVLFKQG